MFVLATIKDTVKVRVSLPWSHRHCCGYRTIADPVECGQINNYQLISHRLQLLYCCGSVLSYLVASICMHRKIIKLQQLPPL